MWPTCPMLPTIELDVILSIHQTEEIEDLSAVLWDKRGRVEVKIGLVLRSRQSRSSWELGDKLTP